MMHIDHSHSRLAAGAARRRFGALAFVAMAFALMGPGLLVAQPQDDAEARTASQRQAMERLSFLDGTWRGTVTSLDRDGVTRTSVQTERVGTLLDGTVRLIEGRGFDQEGAVVFQAFAVLSWDPDRERYNLRSHSGGRTGDFDFQATGDGFVWEVPVGGEARIRYEAVVDGETWRQIGRYLPPNGDPVTILEMDLERIGATDWPEAGAPGPG